MCHVQPAVAFYSGLMKESILLKNSFIKFHSQMVIVIAQEVASITLWWDRDQCGFWAEGGGKNVVSDLIKIKTHNQIAAPT